MPKKISRREALKRFGYVGAGVAASRWVPSDIALEGFARLEPDVAAQRYPQDDPFSHGSASGWINPRDLRITTRLGPNTPVSETYSGLRLFNDQTGELVNQTILLAKNGDDYRVGHTFEGLDPNIRYRYEFNYADSKDTLSGYTHSPKIRALSTLTGIERSFERYAFVCCMNYGAGFWDMMSYVEESNPDMVLFIGDSTYELQAVNNAVREDRMPGGTGYELALMRHWVYNDKHKRKLLSNIPILALPDDHEFENNFGTNKLIDYRTFSGGSLAFSASYPCVPNALVKGFQNSFSTPNGTLMISLDTRTFRDSSKGTMLGSEQLNWLMDLLVLAKLENVKNIIIVTTVSFVSALEKLRDSWPGFERERQHIIDQIAKLDLTNVTFVSGDLHEFYASGVHLDPNNQKTPIIAREFGTGALSSRTGRVNHYNDSVEALGNGFNGVTMMDVYPNGDKIISWPMSNARRNGDPARMGARFYVPNQEQGEPVRISLQGINDQLVRNPGGIDLYS